MLKLKFNIYIFLCFFVLINCKDKNNKEPLNLDKKVSTPYYSKVVDCNTVYKNKGYKIILRTFDTANTNPDFPNCILSVTKKVNAEWVKLFSDSLYSDLKEIDFKNFNNDNVKDILVHHISSARSNWTHHLYIVDTTSDDFKRIKGFEEIPNPNYLPKYDLVDNIVMSGRDWTGFYKIKGDSAIELGYTVYWGQDEHGNPKNPEAKYKK